MINLEEDKLKDLLNTNEKVMVQYGAAWCKKCKQMKPKFSRFSRENEGICFVYVDAEKFPQSRTLATVKSIPTFAGFVNGKLVAEIAGSKQETITEVLEKVQPSSAK